MGYSLNRFLKPLSGSDKTIKIYDDRNFPVHTVNPFSLLRIYVSGNNLNIALSGKRLIVLDFPSNQECKESLLKLQSYIDTIKRTAPVIVEKQQETYVGQAIASAGGIKSFNGSTASIQSLSVENDDNIQIDISHVDRKISATGSAYEGIHSLSIRWTGILPMERGGLNNTIFMDKELLISKTSDNSVVSSGYKIADDEYSDSVIWSADRIMREIGYSVVNKETPIGQIDGANSTFILNHEPIKDSEHIYLNGILQDGDDDSDYSIVGNQITFSEPPVSGSKIKCTYMSKKAYPENA